MNRDLALCARAAPTCLEALRAELLAAHPGIRVLVKPLDVNDYEKVFTVFREFAAELGGLDRVIVNAGMGKGRAGAKAPAISGPTAADRRKPISSPPWPSARLPWKSSASRTRGTW